MENDEILVLSKYPLIANWLVSQCQLLGWKTARDENESSPTFSLINVSSKEDLKILDRLEQGGIPFIIYSQQSPTKLLRILFEYAPKGFIHVSSTLESLQMTLEAAKNGNEYFDEKILTLILSKKYSDIYESIASLSNRELEIVDGIMDEMSNDEIAEKFALSVRTVNAHKRNILQKMKVRSLVGVVKMMNDYTFRYS